MAPSDQTGESYVSATHAKALTAGDSKMGKTTFLVAGALGLLPWQQKANSGAIVTHPSHLHIFSFDPSALSGLKGFLSKSCQINEELLKTALAYRVKNFQKDVLQVSQTKEDYNFNLFNGVLAAIEEERQRIRSNEVHAFIFSSVSVLAESLKRALFGPPGKVNERTGQTLKSNADQNKWDGYSSQLVEIRNFAQSVDAHVIWEAHTYKPASNGQNKDDEVPQKETINIQGKQGALWAGNVEQVFRIRREFGQRWGSTQCDKVYLDTQPTGDFIANGRGFNESLLPKEYDLTEAFAKLGLKVGRWGRRAVAKTPEKNAPQQSTSKK